MENKKKKRIKNIAFIMSLIMLLLISGGVGYALAQMTGTLNLGGDISFSAGNIYATISKGTVGGGTLADSDSKLQEIVYDMNNDVSQSTALETWNGLDITFAESGEDVTISFTITNKHTERNLKVSIGTPTGTYSNVNKSISINDDVMSGSDSYVVLEKNGAQASVVITFSIEDKDKSASVTNFSFGFTLVNTDDEATIHTTVLYRYTEDGTGIYFGSYPQTIKASTVSIVDTTPDATTGYYTGSDGEEYAKYTVNYSALDSIESGLSDYFDDSLKMNQASDGTKMQSGTDYYFKVEDLEWKIISTTGSNVATVVCTSIIKGQAYQPNSKLNNGYYYAKDESGNILTDEGNNIYANNYEYSALRKYLIEEFYNTAFTTLQQELIQTITVDNSATSTGKESNIYACSNTSDKVWALSYAEIMNLVKDETSEDVDVSKLLDYLFATTDYAKATNALTCTKEYFDKLKVSVYEVLEIYGMLEGTESESMIYNDCTGAQKTALDTIYVSGGWWLRSPDSSDGNDAYDVNLDGIDSNDVYNPIFGVVPALQIQL